MYVYKPFTSLESEDEKYIICKDFDLINQILQKN